MKLNKKGVLALGLGLCLTATTIMGCSALTLEEDNSYNGQEINLYNIDAIRVVEDLPGGPDLFVNKKSNHYTIIGEDRQFILIQKNVVGGRLGATEINPEYVYTENNYPLYFYLTAEEREKDELTIEELLVIRERIVESMEEKQLVK
jgi:hypothetical protein